LLQEQQLSLYSARFRHAYGFDRLQRHASASASPNGDRPAARGGVCTVSILKHGPTRILPGKPFNPQHNGRSAFWLTVPADTPVFAIEFEGERIPTVRRGGVVTYYHDDRQVAAAQAGRALKFDVICEGKRVNSFEVAVR
jgi:hypothetical protein